MSATHGGTVARSTNTLRFLEDGVQPLLSLAEERYLGLRIFAAVQERVDAAGNLDWDVHYVDGTTVRAHQHAAGAKGGIPSPKH